MSKRLSKGRRRCQEVSFSKVRDLLVKEAIKRRKERRISQRRLAAIAEVSQPTISRFEQQKEDIQLSSALKIFEVLGLVEK